MKEFSEGARTLFILGALAAIVIALCLLLIGVFGPVGNNIDNALFNSSPTHQQGVATLLTNDCTDLERADTASDKHMIEVKIRQDASGVDVDQIPMDQTVRNCVHQAFEDSGN